MPTMSVRRIACALAVASALTVLSPANAIADGKVITLKKGEHYSIIDNKMLAAVNVYEGLFLKFAESSRFSDSHGRDAVEVHDLKGFKKASLYDSGTLHTIEILSHKEKNEKSHTGEWVSNWQSCTFKVSSVAYKWKDKSVSERSFTVDIPKSTNTKDTYIRKTKFIKVNQDPLVCVGFLHALPEVGGVSLYTVCPYWADFSTVPYYDMDAEKGPYVPPMLRVKLKQEAKTITGTISQSSNKKLPLRPILIDYEPF